MGIAAPIPRFPFIFVASYKVFWHFSIYRSEKLEFKTQSLSYQGDKFQWIFKI